MHAPATGPHAPACDDGAEQVRPAQPDDLGRLAELAAEALDALGAARGGARLLREGRLAQLAASIRQRGERSPGADLTGQLGALAASLDCLLLGGWYAGALVGVALAERVEARDGVPGATSSAAIEMLYVEPAARGVGVGGALLAGVLDWCAAAGCAGLDVVALPGDRTTKSLLEQHGFRARAIVMHAAVPSDPQPSDLQPSDLQLAVPPAVVSDVRPDLPAAPPR